MKRVLILLMVFAVVLTGCAPKQEAVQPATEAPATEAPTEATTEPATTAATEPTTEPTTAPTEPPDPIRELVDTMTLEEKVGQLFLARCPSADAAEDVATYHLGGYILFGRDFEFKTAEEILTQVQSYQDNAKIPLIIGVDEEGGTVTRVSSQFILREEKFQSPQKLYAAGGMERIIADTVEKDALLAFLGINVNFAPVADVSTNSADFIYARSFGQDAEATAQYTSAVVEQMTKDQMGSSLKHFPGYGSNIDTHNGIAVDERPLETFLTQDLLPFMAHTAGNGMTSIMVSHNIVTAMDPDMPASLSASAHQLLREELGFDGVVMTDALDMGAVQKYTDGGNIAVTALLAGNDMLLVCDYTTGIPAILEAIDQGTLTEDAIDTACYRVLTWKQALGLI